MFYLRFTGDSIEGLANILLKKDELSKADSEVAWKVAQVPPGRTESSWKPGIVMRTRGQSWGQHHLTFGSDLKDRAGHTRQVCRGQKIW